MALEYVVDTGNAVTLGDGIHVIQTVEHLMAALHTKGITDLYLEIDSLEIPFLFTTDVTFYLSVSRILGKKQSEELKMPIRIRR